MRILAFDPSMNNWGIVEAVYVDGLLTSIKGEVISPPKSSLKSKTHSDIATCAHIWKCIQPKLSTADFVVTELPLGARSAMAVKGIGIVLGILSICSVENSNFFGYHPGKLKESFTGNRNAGKSDMIARALELYPSLNWPYKTLHGKQELITTKAEHIADACSVLHHFTSLNRELICK